MNSYVKPEWSGEPGTLYALEVLKAGVSLEEVGLMGKECFMLGRGEDCDVVLAHPSVSRWHAVLQHNTSGDLFLYDLGSTHGTSVNGKLVEPKVYFQVYTGDTIRFASSSRIYVVNGPDEKQRPVTSKMFSEDGRLLLAPKSKQSTPDLQSTLRQLEDQHRRQQDYEIQMKARLQEVSWGFGEDAKEDALNPQDQMLYEDVLDLEQVKMRGDVTDRHLKQISLIEEKRRKLDSLQREASNLTRKEEEQEEGLTRGQSQRLTQNQQKLSDLREEIGIEEEKLRNMFLEPEMSTKRTIAKDDSSDDDEYFDRVSKRPKTQAADPDLSYESALQLYQTTLQARDKLLQSLSALNDSKANEEEDEFEAFMQQNRLALNAENRMAIAGQMKEMNDTVERLHATLAKLNPGRFVDYIRETDEKLIEKQRPKPAIHPTPEPTMPESPPPPLPAPFQKPQKYGVTAKPPSRNVAEEFTISREELESAYGSAEVTESVKKEAGRKLQWQPPKGQTGDGRTALNEKYKY